VGRSIKMIIAWDQRISQEISIGLLAMRQPTVLNIKYKMGVD